MLDSRDPFLFQGSDFFAELEATKRFLAAEIEEIPGDRFLNTDPDEWVAYFINKHQFEVPQLRESEITVDQTEVTVFVRDAFSSRAVRGTRISYSVPFIGDDQFFSFQPSAGTSIVPHGTLHGDELLISFEGTNMNDQQVRAEFDRQLEQVRFRLNSLQEQVKSFHQQLPNLTRNLVQGRRQKLEKDRGLVVALGFPLKRRDDSVAKLAIPVTRKKLELQLPEADKAREPYLELAQYEEILGTIQSMALVIERSPGAFQDLHEEELRWRRPASNPTLRPCRCRQ
jgi:hypothetical protein